MIGWPEVDKFAIIRTGERPWAVSPDHKRGIMIVRDLIIHSQSIQTNICIKKNDLFKNGYVRRSKVVFFFICFKDKLGNKNVFGISINDTDFQFKYFNRTNIDAVGIIFYSILIGILR